MPPLALERPSSETFVRVAYREAAPDLQRYERLCNSDVSRPGNLIVFENNKPFVIDEFREGRFDYVELASHFAETKFFQFRFGQPIVEKLVQHYPSLRERHHVALWM